MKISDLKESDIKVGLRIKSLTSNKLGTIVRIDEHDDHYAWILWDGTYTPYSGFYSNHCECEVV